MEAVIREAITDALHAAGLEAPEFSVEHPADLAHGDYATNAALIAAKDTGKSPREIAGDLVSALDGSIEYVERIEVASPGFLNFYLERDFFTAETERCVTLGEGWGRNELWKGKTVVVEYTDPNPFKEFHVGHVFTNAVGESIARLFMMAGADTKRVNYQGDVGMHVACALWGMQELGFAGARDFSARELGKAYALGATAYKEDTAAAEEIKVINKTIYERNDDTLNALYDKGREVSLAYFEEVYALLGTEFDAYFFESEAAEPGRKLVLGHPDVFEKSDGAYVFHGEKEGLHTRVFLNSEGLPTYEAKELALAKLKEERLGSYDHSVISTAREINEYFKVLLAAMKHIYPELAEKTEHIGHGMVRLPEGKMSSRSGEIIAGVDFIESVADRAREKMRANGTEDTEGLAESVAVAAIKYSTLKANISQDSVFDQEKALSFEGDSGPYLQYTHARICSVLAKAADHGVAPSYETVPDQSYEIERILYRFPEVVSLALTERTPHHVVSYLTELASSFNSFYATERIADKDDAHAPYKAALAKAVGQTLKNGLWVLGIQAPERM